MILILDCQQIDIDAARRVYDQRDYAAYCDCPIGQAARRQFGIARERVEVSEEYLRVRLPGNSEFTRYTVTETMRAFMERWDEHNKARPRRFRLVEEIA